MRFLRFTIISALIMGLTYTAAAKGKGNDSLYMEDCIIEYVTEHTDVAVSYPELRVPASSKMALQRLADNLNSDACLMIAESSVLYNADSSSVAGAQRADDSRMLEMYLLQQSTLSDMDQSELMPTAYDLYSEWEAFANEHIITVFQKVYSFKGGAHGMTYCSFNNYLRASGERFEFADIIEDKEAFVALVAKYFCKERKLSEGAIMAQTGLDCELSDMPMPSEIGLCKKGLAVVYQQTEIGPYSMGVVAVVIPFKEFKDILHKEFFDIKSLSGGIEGYNEKVKESVR